MIASDEPLNLLSVYQSACARGDVAAAVACFAEEGALEFAGGRYAGRAALTAAHEWDVQARNFVALDDVVVDGDRVTCVFANQHELHRVLGLGRMHSAAEITVRAGRIVTLRIMAPEDADLRRFRERAAPFFDWARANRADTLRAMNEFDATGGRALYELATAWRLVSQP